MGKLVEIKTKPTALSVDDFIDTISDESKRDDSREIMNLMKSATGEEPKMWGTSMIGFGEVRYKSPATGREVDWFKMGFSPRKANFSLHLNMNLKLHDNDLAKLGKYKTGVGCLYIKKLDEVDVNILKKIINAAAN